MAQQKNSRNWVGTLNNYTEEERTALLELEGTKYIVVGKEVAPDTGTPHLQFAIFFKSQRSFASVCKKMPRAHWERMKGTQEQAAEYCKKDGDFFEVGAFCTPKAKGETQKIRFERAWELARDGNLDDIDADIKLRFYGTLKRIKHDAMLETVLGDTESVMQWYYGPSGTGKSRKAREENPEAYLKMCNKW